MKKICFLNSAMSWGGGEKWHFEMASFLSEKGFSVYFITSPQSELHKKLIKSAIHCIPFKVTNLSFLNPLRILRLKNILHNHQIDTLIINLSSDLKLAGLAAKAAKTRRIIYRRGSAIPIKNSVLNRFYFKNIITDVLANSQATKRTILQNNAGLFPENKIKVIYNPLNTEAFLKKTYTKTYQKKNGELVIGNLGRLVPQKNQKFLIDLAVELKTRKIAFKILIGGSGALENELKTYAKAKNVSKEVIFAGFFDNVKSLLMSCDIFVLPSLWEGFGYVLAEASLCKKPAIAFNVSSNPELVVNNKTGFLTPVNDINEFVQKILFFLKTPELIEDFGENAFSYASEKFKAANVESELLDYLSY